MNYCALCCIAKDEDIFFKEWLAYHALIGFEHFIIYDDVSAVPVARLLEGWAPPERVTVNRHSARRDQIATYNHCLSEYGRRFKWIAFLDLDEFIRIGPALPSVDRARSGRTGQTGKSGERGEVPDIRVFLSEFEPYAALGLNWRMFSSGGHDKRPKGPVIGNYTRCLGDDIHIKSIVQPALIQECAGAHSFRPVPGAHAANAAHFPIPPGFYFTVPATERAAVHHYYYKSREDFELKTQRGNPCNIERRMSDFDCHLNLPDAPDQSLVPYAGLVRQACAADRLPEAPAPVAPPDACLPADVPHSIANARACIKESRERAGGSPVLRQALLHLCAAACDNEADGHPDPLIALEIWTLRAEAAMLEGQWDVAEHCLRQAFTYGAGYKAQAELANLLLHRGRLEDAKHALTILKYSGTANQ